MTKQGSRIETTPAAHSRGEAIGVEHVCSVLDAVWRERREERYRIAPLPGRRAMLAGWRPQT